MFDLSFPRKRESIFLLMIIYLAIFLIISKNIVFIGFPLSWELKAITFFQ